MTSRHWYLAKSVALRLLVLCGLAWWVMVIVLAVKTREQPFGKPTPMSQFIENLLSSPQ
jgi:hypothetical protein